MALPSFKRKRAVEKTAAPVTAVQTARQGDTRFDLSRIGGEERRLYAALRHAVPLIDAAISKLVRLCGGFDVVCSSVRAQKALEEFLRNVPVGLSGRGIDAFLDSYLDSLLTYGNAAGEILLFRGSEQVAGLVNVDASALSVRAGVSPVTPRYALRSFDDTEENERELPFPQLILFSALYPPNGSPYGVSLLRGLPAISNILLRIYESIGQNFERVGNVRYAVTYKPNGETDKAYAKERAMQIAKEWSEGMAAAKYGNIKDFVAVGDVDIKVIGAENQLIDTQVPVRQLLEQMVAKLSIPPFLLGLNWTTTERMSKQQVDILTSELQHYRRLLTPIILRICNAFLSCAGYTDSVEVQWQGINLQDEVELAGARLQNARAAEIEARLQS